RECGKYIGCESKRDQGSASMANTQSRTAPNAGKAAITAPKPTRLAILSTGNAEAFALPKVGQFAAVEKYEDGARCCKCDDGRPTACHGRKGGAARNEASIRGRTTSDISWFTATTMNSGKTATAGRGPSRPWPPCAISAGSNSRTVGICSWSFSLAATAA